MNAKVTLPHVLRGANSCNIFQVVPTKSVTWFVSF